MSSNQENFPSHQNDDWDGIEFLKEDDLVDLNAEEPDVNSGSSDNEKANRKNKKNSHTTRPEKKPTFWSELFSYVKIFVVAIVIAFIFTQYIIVNAQVPTGSMKDTIMEGDRLIGFRLAYTFSDPQRGDIVIFKYPDDETQNYVKRIIGIPGDVVEIKDGHVYVNGEELDESYIKEDMISTDTDETYVVPEGHYFMMGDNRNYSRDSRYWDNTYVSRDEILAKVIFRYYSGSSHSISFSMLQ